MIKEKKKSVGKFAGLSNEELVLIQEKFVKYLEGVNKNLEQNQVYQKEQTPIGEAIRVHVLSNKQVDEFKNSEYYKLSNSIVAKLSPIVDIIKDSQPEALKNLSK